MRTTAVPNGMLAMMGTAELTLLYVVNASQNSDIGASIAPTMPGISLVSGGRFPSCAFDTRANIRFQYGCEARPMSIPTPIPRKERPISWELYACLRKMMGKAWKARYRIPRMSEFHMSRRRTMRS
jgi:hypothetical protein